MMVGALVLASCVKNQESQSVTDVRNARADEIKSQAELNRANAEAAVIYAKAEATVAAAQAQLLQAQADKAAAEAALIQAQADLAQVNVQIQLVKLEEEKVVLQAKKAELEKLVAEYEAAIAQADALKQEAINRLEKAVQQAELDEIKHQKALIDAQANLIQSLNGFADAQRNRVVALYTAYANATKQVYTLQAQLLQKQAALAKIEAHIDSGAEETYEAILAKKKEISTLQSRIEMIEYFSFESYEAALAEYEALMPAYVTASIPLSANAPYVFAQATPACNAVTIISSAIRNALAAHSKPVFMTGDWNATPTSKPLAAMRLFMTILSDTKGRTFHGFKPNNPATPYCIDYIAVDSLSAKRIVVRDSHVVPDVTTSDHSPVVAVVNVSEMQSNK